MRKMVGCALVFGLALVACGDDDSDDSVSSTTAVDSSLPDDQQLSTLTDAEAAELTASLEGAVESEEVRNAVCQFAGAFSAAFVPAAQAAEACEQAVAECMASPLEPDSTTMGMSDDQLSAAMFADCSVTVGQFEQCLNDTYGFMIEALAQFDCSSAADPSSAAAVPEMEEVSIASCAPLDSCAALAEQAEVTPF